MCLSEIRWLREYFKATTYICLHVTASSVFYLLLNSTAKPCRELNIKLDRIKINDETFVSGYSICVVFVHTVANYVIVEWRRIYLQAEIDCSRNILYHDVEQIILWIFNALAFKCITSSSLYDVCCTPLVCTVIYKALNHSHPISDLKGRSQRTQVRTEMIWVMTLFAVRFFFFNSLNITCSFAVACIPDCNSERAHIIQYHYLQSISGLVVCCPNAANNQILMFSNEFLL